ncbi:tetratricopeptide repeat protein [Thalassotalea euphylliae]|uniref:tetratricopeptide repeat protein n=1 Tax=Thalassotalea euphylliae TaxID=1655234 RepID=UPI0011C04253|nr:tetratricopeptide repeat protein [Thalassotalea euphylliae]
MFITLVLSNKVIGANRDNTTCGIEQGVPLQNAYGPWDFTNPAHSSKLPIVLGAHFTSNVEKLKSGQTGKLIADIDYTLRAIPNYHRALYAMAKHQRIEKMAFRNIDKYYTADCYFKRALYFQPNDAISHMIYAIHLQQTQRLEEAKEHYRVALTLLPENPEINYNAGLLYVKLGDLVKARQHAEVAYQQGYPLQGLAKQIENFSNVE